VNRLADAAPGDLELRVLSAQLVVLRKDTARLMLDMREGRGRWVTLETCFEGAGRP